MLARIAGACLLLASGLTTGCAATSKCASISDMDERTACYAGRKVRSEVSESKREERQEWERCAEYWANYHRSAVTAGTITRSQAINYIRMDITMRCGTRPIGAAMPIL